MSTALSPMENTVLSFEGKFNEVNAYKLNFKKEANFALQSLKANNFLRSTAQDNPDSLLAAITNIAAIGISLNPALREAYLVPRSKEVKLDISYMGLAKLATDSGSIKWVQAELVRKNDKFILQEMGKAPIHQFEPFGERGEIVGGYVVAKTIDDEYLVTFMTIQECHDIRNRTESWKAYQAKKIQSCPWSTDEGEMIKKTIVKRAYKMWPKSKRLAEAIELLNEHEGIDFSREKTPHVAASSMSTEAPEDHSELFDKLKEAKRTPGELITYLKERFPGDGEIFIDELSGPQYAEAIKALDSIISKQKGNK
jgi:recombination protein RecT